MGGATAHTRVCRRQRIALRPIRPRSGCPARLGPPLSEDARIDLDALVQPYLGPLIVGLVVVVVVLFLALVSVARRTRRIDARLRGLTRGEGGHNLEAVLDAHLDRVDAVARELDELAARAAILEGAQRRSFQRVGLVRYNPFEETGGNQSFALALLDGAGNGWVLSSLHARSGTRVYAKGISAGRADAALSEEETAAIRQAMA
jgi:hypothetical protein